MWPVLDVFVFPFPLKSSSVLVFRHLVLIQFVLCVCKFHINGFNQPQIENVKKKKKSKNFEKIRKKKHMNLLHASYLNNIYTVLGYTV